jgi:GT2 family glycosyltransferase
VIDNGSSDATQDVVAHFSAKVAQRVVYEYEGLPGLGRARNAGIRAATGDLLVFSDDDCFFDKNYFNHLPQLIDTQKYGYGGGQILLADERDDTRVANLRLKEVRIIPAHSYCLSPGIIQGANVIFTRRVFDVAGYFRDDMGAGTPFPCEDIEMATRASNAGFVGALFPDLVVYHDHGRRMNSAEALATLRDYDRGRGAYYASLILEGRVDVLDNWLQRYRAMPAMSCDTFAGLAREMRSAADLIDGRGLSPEFQVPVCKRQPH